MRRTASEVIRNLERRIARLERQASRTDQEDLDWDAYTHTQPVEYTDRLLDENERVIDEVSRRYNFKGTSYDKGSAIEDALGNIAEDLPVHNLEFDDLGRGTIKFYYLDNTPYFEDEFDEDDLDRCASAELEIKLIGLGRKDLEALVEMITDHRRFNRTI